MECPYILLGIAIAVVSILGIIGTFSSSLPISNDEGADYAIKHSMIVWNIDTINILMLTGLD